MFGDRVKETSTTTGTSDFTLLGAVSGFESFVNNFAVGERFYYTIVLGTAWEVGIGYLSSSFGNPLVRDVVLNSTNGDALVSFGAGTKTVFSTIPASHAKAASSKGIALALARGAYIR